MFFLKQVAYYVGKYALKNGLKFSVKRFSSFWKKCSS